MKRCVVWGLVLLCLAMVGQTLAQDSLQGMQPGQSCTVFYAANDELALGGNNEDWRNPFTKVWFMTADAEHFGRVYFGFDDFWPQGGVNDQGLFFDGLATPTIEVPDDPDREAYPGNLLDAALSQCATVDCVIDLFGQYDVPDFLHNAQFLYGDASGASVIIEPLHIRRIEGSFQVATNFYQSGVAPEDISDWRYKTATDMLSEADSLSVELFRDVLAATHQEGDYPTLYSNIYDLRQGLIYLYHFHHYDDVVVINVADELAKGQHVLDIPALFAENSQYERWAEAQLQAFYRHVDKHRSTAVAPQLYARYDGAYQIPPEVGLPYPYVEVSHDTEHLYLDLPQDWMPGLEMFPVSETEFFYSRLDDEAGFDVRFVLDDSGETIAMIYQVEGMPAITLPRMTD